MKRSCASASAQRVPLLYLVPRTTFGLVHPAVPDILDIRRHIQADGHLVALYSIMAVHRLRCYPVDTTPLLLPHVYTHGSLLEQLSPPEEILCLFGQDACCILSSAFWWDVF